MKKYYGLWVFLSMVSLFLMSCSQEQFSNVNTEVIEGITMVTIPAGSFSMGNNYKEDRSISNTINKYFPDEEPVHTVTLSTFQIGATEITQFQYKAFTGNNPSTFKGNDNLPVTNVGASDALKFCNILSETAGLDPCYDEDTGKCDFSKNGFRLPTEAEWEYACRAGTKTHFYNGNSESDLNRVGWYINNSGGKTHPVAQKEPNSWGLYDMHGNVYEYCYDGCDRSAPKGYPSGSVYDPISSEIFTYRIMRGGGWFSESASCRSFTRSMFWTGGANYYIGFRIARSI